MKQIKKITIILALVLLVGANATAQITRRGQHSSHEEYQETYTQGVGWIHTPVGSNWYFDLEANAHLYYGYQDRLGDFKDRLNGSITAYLGRWVFPMIGFRVGLGYSEYNGFISVDAYNQYRPHVGYGSCDYTPGNLPLGGYYHYYDNNPNLYHQHWRAAYLAPDLMINMSYMNFYNPKKIFTTYIYAGISLNVGLCENAYDLYGNLQSGWRLDPNFSGNGHIGFIENLRITDKLKVYGDVRLTIYEGRFDRENVVGVEKGLRAEDYGLSVSVGFNYAFHFMTQKNYNYWYRATIDPYHSENSDTPDHLYATHNIDVDVVRETDSLYMSDTLSEFDPLFKHWVDSLADLMSRQPIDELLAGYDACDTCNLRQILTRQLVPFEMVFYEIDKWDIHTSEALKIAKMAHIMKRFPNHKFLLFGSADSKTGTVQRNEFLSVNRADVVYNKLIYEYDIPEEQLKRVYLGGILNYEPFELNRATVIIMEHPKVMEEFLKLRDRHQAGGSEVEIESGIIR